jgi:hypothetical protein
LPKAFRANTCEARERGGRHKPTASFFHTGAGWVSEKPEEAPHPQSRKVVGPAASIALPVDRRSCPRTSENSVMTKFGIAPPR